MVLSERFHHRCFAETVRHLINQSIPTSHITDVLRDREVGNGLQVAVCGPDGVLADYEPSILDLFFGELEFSGVEDHPSSTAVCKNVANSGKRLFHRVGPLDYIVNYLIVVLCFWFPWATIENCVRSLSITIVGGAISLRGSGITETEPALLCDECSLMAVF